MSERLQRILNLHCDPVSGSPYWLNRQKTLGFSIPERIQTLADLHQLGAFDLNDLNRFPLEHFIPAGVLHRQPLITAETGGATGHPKATAYVQSEFIEAFVEPFIQTTGWNELVADGNWLWVGPSGPHIIGKAAREIALRTTGSDGFSVDFDPRWYRKLAPQSIARQRYMEHLVQQALTIIQQQTIDYLFSTPVVLLSLAEPMTDPQKARIRFIYLGGMSVTVEALQALGDHFPQAQFLSGYGNTLFGVSHERKPHRPDGELPIYFSPADRLVIQMIPLDATLPDSERIQQQVAYGETGQVMMHRLGETFFLPNVIERDCGVRVASNQDGSDGVMNPRPVQQNQFKVENGIY